MYINWSLYAVQMASWEDTLPKKLKIGTCKLCYLFMDLSGNPGQEACTAQDASGEGPAIQVAGQFQAKLECSA